MQARSRSGSPGPVLPPRYAASVGPVPMPHNWMDFDEARAPIDDLSRFSLAPSNCPHVMTNWFGLKAGPRTNPCGTSGQEMPVPTPPPSLDFGVWQAGAIWPNPQTTSEFLPLTH